MIDRENVITHLQIIHTWAEFARERDLQFFTPKHLENIAEWTDDALELLKEQEPVKPIPPEDELSLYRCGKCHHPLFRCVDKYCSRCGRSVKWE